MQQCAPVRMSQALLQRPSPATRQGGRQGRRGVCKVSADAAGEETYTAVLEKPLQVSGHISAGCG